jgi:hypothetical protein
MYSSADSSTWTTVTVASMANSISAWQTLEIHGTVPSNATGVCFAFESDVSHASAVELYLDLLSVKTEQDIPVTVPVKKFRQGDSVWGEIQKLAGASMAEYCGFRGDGKFVFNSMLADNWEGADAEYVLTATDVEGKLSMHLVPVSCNSVKVRGVDVQEYDQAVVLWELRKVKPVGTNAAYPSYCWELLQDDEYFECDPPGVPVRKLTFESSGYTSCVAGDVGKQVVGGTSADHGQLVDYNNNARTWEVSSDHFFAAPEAITITGGSGAGSMSIGSTGIPQREYWVQYAIEGAEILSISSLTMTVTTFEGDALTDTSDLDAEPSRGKIVLRNETGALAHIMNIRITGKPTVSRTLRTQVPDEAALRYLLAEKGLAEGDDAWGRVITLTNASSITTYGQVDIVDDSEYYVDWYQMACKANYLIASGKDPRHIFDVTDLPFTPYLRPGCVVWFGYTNLGYSHRTLIRSVQHDITPDRARTSVSLWEDF